MRATRRKINRGHLGTSEVSRIMKICVGSAQKMMDGPDFPGFRLPFGRRQRRVEIEIFESYLGGFPKEIREVYLARLDVVLGEFSESEVPCPTPTS